MQLLSWDEAILELERSSQRLLAGLPGDLPLIEDALERRARAVEQIQAMGSAPDANQLQRLQQVAQMGDIAGQQLLLAREQIRDNIARLNNSSFLTNAFSPNAVAAVKRFDCEG